MKIKAQLWEPNRNGAFFAWLELPSVPSSGDTIFMDADRKYTVASILWTRDYNGNDATVVSEGEWYPHLHCDPA